MFYSLLPEAIDNRWNKQKTKQIDFPCGERLEKEMLWRIRALKSSNTLLEIMKATHMPMLYVCSRNT